MVTGCAASMPRDGHWLVDDVAVIDDPRWRDAGVALLEAIPERPALTAVPTADTARALASELAGLRHVSSYWIRATQPGEWRSQPLHSGLDVPAAPPHTFGGVDPWADGALSFADGGGFVVGSASMAAPPVYDPGGTVCVVDRVVGTDRAGLLRSALAAAAHRGDVVLNVVAAPDDVDLQNHLARPGFERTVDVFAWQ